MQPAPTSARRIPDHSFSIVAAYSATRASYLEEHCTSRRSATKMPSGECSPIIAMERGVVDGRHLVLWFLTREGPHQLAWYVGWAGEECHRDDDHASSHGTGRPSAAVDCSTSTPFFRTRRSNSRIGPMCIEEW